ncbi:MAG: hypothetical protein HXY43_24795 [Fischerella sp.]|jgi:hypothetical protein|uniref:hypothetical protein n=1 Tax=Fischerella sp. TaxID=1191 RepID=UPI0017D407EF|nr:hypothetical protein [Fischerella sp.]NWF62374.1 hypothetical protein [Fischerella sp.]
MQLLNFRQGDVLLQSCPEMLPPEKTKLPHLVLAEGEVTGHKHQITDGQAELYRFDQDGTLFLQVQSETATLTHDEHKPIQIPQGTWMIRIQREYEPEREGWRHVTD